MTEGLKKAWAEMVQPLLRRPPEVQVAALCGRESDDGIEVLLMTSRDSGRWIVPKGWLMDGKSAAEAAREEAWEEAGVKTAMLTPVPVGTFAYEKRLDTGYCAPAEVQVFYLDVSELSDIYPEARERERKWVSPAQAAEMVNEPGLKAIFQEM